MTEYIISQSWKGWGLWVSEKDGMSKNSVSPYFPEKEEAETYKTELIEKELKK